MSGALADYLVEHDKHFPINKLSSLYSDLEAQRSHNPDGFRIKVAAWAEGLAHLAWAGKLPVSSTPTAKSTANTSPPTSTSHVVLEVSDALSRGLETRRFGRPEALETVVAELVAQRRFLPTSAFLEAQESIYTMYTSTWSPLNVVSWAVGKVWNNVRMATPPAPEPVYRSPLRGQANQYVIVQNLERAAELLLAKVERTGGGLSRMERVYSKAHFAREFTRLEDASSSSSQSLVLSPTDMEMLLLFLSRDKDAIVYDGRYVRVRGGATDRNDEPSRITDEDEAIGSLRDMIAELRQQTTAMDHRIEVLQAAARDAVAKKNRVSALAALKSKKMTETALAKRYTTLHQLEGVRGQMEQAADQVQFVQIMEASAGVLKQLNERVGGVERVEQVLEAVRDEAAEVEDVAERLTSAAAEGALSAAGVDEEALDEELQALEDATRRDQQEQWEAHDADEVAARFHTIPSLAEASLPDLDRLSLVEEKTTTLPELDE